MSQLIASASGLDELQRIAKKFYRGASIHFEPDDYCEWDVFNANGKINEVKVRKKAGRYRLERRNER